MTSRRAFIAPVSEPLNGAWHDLADFVDVEDLQTAALEKIKRTAENNYGEELDCSDYDGFGSLFAGNHYTGLTELFTAHEWLEACEKTGIDSAIALAYRATLGGRDLPDVSDIQDAYQGTFSSAEDFGLYWVQDVLGEYDKIPDDIVLHVDWRSYGEALLRGDFWEADVAGGIAVFRHI
jgi:antirestriction protein